MKIVPLFGQVLPVRESDSLSYKCSIKLVGQNALCPESKLLRALRRSEEAYLWSIIRGKILLGLIFPF